MEAKVVGQQGSTVTIKVYDGNSTLCERKVSGPVTNPRVVTRGDGYRSWVFLRYKQDGQDREICLGPPGGIK